MNWYIDAWKHYFDFEGRASRKAYWMFVLFNFIFACAALVLDAVLGLNLFYPLYGLATLILSISIAVRRFHDTDRSGWNFLWNLLPVVGWIIVLVLLVLAGTSGANRFGEDSYAPAPAEGPDAPTCDCD